MTFSDSLNRDGFAILEPVFDAAALEAMAAGLAAALSVGGPEVRGQVGEVYAARDLLSLWPGAADIWRVSPLPETLAAVLGPRFGLVQALYFDKPPERGWSVPWHRDITIPVRDNCLPSTSFIKPTVKSGVPYVEAPVAVLESLLSARIHLDPSTPDNGPLEVLPGSHRFGKGPVDDDRGRQPLLCKAGGVILIRPLTAHCSGKPRPGSALRRRVLHLVFAEGPDLPDGFQWRHFISR